jgi:putative tryptophan/tyrosine transport system substrate-binding protein
MVDMRRREFITLIGGTAAWPLAASYGFDLMGLFYDIASYVHQIARGSKPSDMPIEQSPRFYMSVNLKTAASLGISLPDVFVARANEVRE